jgi:AraC-like DNA-binding protein
MKKNSHSTTPAYRIRLSKERSDRLYSSIVDLLETKKCYRNPNYSAKQMAEELNTNSRYISAAVANVTGDNYSALINRYRLRDARRMLRSPRLHALSIEKIGLLSGFASRQSFYIAFTRAFSDETPAAYRSSAKLAASNAAHRREKLLDEITADDELKVLLS